MRIPCEDLQSATIGSFFSIGSLKQSSHCRVQWLCVGGQKDWAGDTFTFSMEEFEGGVKTKFTQEYSNTMSDEQ